MRTCLASALVALVFCVTLLGGCGTEPVPEAQSAPTDDESLSFTAPRGRGRESTASGQMAPRAGPRGPLIMSAGPGLFAIDRGGESTVSGKATLNGEPLVAGRVLLFTTNGLVLSPGAIDGAGSYKLTGVPDGPASVLVLLDPNGRVVLPFAPKEVWEGGDPQRGTVAPRLPGPFLEQLRFTVPAHEQARYRAAHIRYGRGGPAHPLKLTVAGNTTFDLVLTS
ncbi:hypothetical protein J8F10_26915 [Gemmata sp. G18]|uniref:Carboxypeptidase regulatory-like domain-containing protein n=1 Tax=Gemmata palustris TaxID=2822762 RepID=A0ABS5BZ08_9BACT|nr:hypothetical protein [Gemmata palustris]MBP3958893.1 hypothetical protein [Gemmata palustris]